MPGRLFRWSRHLPTGEVVCVCAPPRGPRSVEESARWDLVGGTDHASYTEQQVEIRLYVGRFAAPTGRLLVKVYKDVASDECICI